MQEERRSDATCYKQYCTETEKSKYPYIVFLGMGGVEVNFGKVVNKNAVNAGVNSR